jgi:hypothetical protein
VLVLPQLKLHLQNVGVLQMNKLPQLLQQENVRKPEKPPVQLFLN